MEWRMRESSNRSDSLSPPRWNLAASIQYLEVRPPFECTRRRLEPPSFIPLRSISEVTTDPVLGWLLDPSEPAMQYLATRDLVHPRPSDWKLARLRAEIPSRGWAMKIFARQKAKTYWATKRACYVPKFTATIWQLQVLADLGITRRDERIRNAVDLWFDLHIAQDGGFTPWSRLEGKEFRRIHFRHRERFMKRGHLCTTGNMVRSLIRFGYLDDERVRSAIDWLVDKQLEDGGWDCFGRPNGTLDAWEAMSALAEIPSTRRSSGAKRALERGAEFFLERRLLHEGNRFERWWWLRYPWHYNYDVLVGLDFMTALGHGKDPRMREAFDHIVSKRLLDGRWNLDSTNGNLALESRGTPSKMITFLALRSLQRARRIRVA